MPDLFPENMDFEITEMIESESESVGNFKKSYAFDFEKGEFIRGPDGKILLVNRLEAYKQWCQKALCTKRNKHLSYSNMYGQEYYTLIGQDINKEAIELEVERMTREALMVHPYTRRVENFSFEWDKNKEHLYFSFDVITVLDELFTLEHSEEMR
ncbi:DUF2634 domain-containing protein [Clostridium formicaceticum]|uniref:DUF2634 domain-containing protein n=1 Tax=Clostridium formicaceticum TaxID=1497 RepID=A0AAC9RLU3_9CLOT|nr:DUF2634 domain-containing protein [Clostridium formicaceticum]AOY77185.1 hypothetical protein BJL90_15815 [Clostridium formicaceticum]ARE87708.1 hypothetical protein CLFO_21080 [Clostridium formicaceticum]